MPGPLGTRLQTSIIWTATIHEQTCNLSIMFLSWTICKKPCDSSRHPIQTYSKENPSAHQRGCTENAEHLPSEICSLLCADSRRISPEAEIFKHLIRSADLAQLQSLFPVYLFEILCPAKMPAAIRSTAQCRKHSCVYELGKQRKLFQFCSKTERWVIGLGQPNFSPVFPLLSFSSQVCIEMSLAFATSFTLSTWAWEIVWSGLDNTVIKQPKMTSDLRDWKNYRRKASLKEKNPL